MAEHAGHECGDRCCSTCCGRCFADGIGAVDVDSPANHILDSDCLAGRQAPAVLQLWRALPPTAALAAHARCGRVWPAFGGLMQWCSALAAACACRVVRANVSGPGAAALCHAAWRPQTARRRRRAGAKRSASVMLGQHSQTPSRSWPCDVLSGRPAAPGSLQQDRERRVFFRFQKAAPREPEPPIHGSKSSQFSCDDAGGVECAGGAQEPS